MDFSSTQPFSHRIIFSTDILNSGYYSKSEHWFRKFALADKLIEAVKQQVRQSSILRSSKCSKHSK
ncbi:hypothetical protein CS546_08960 [Porphyromonas gingivalis]|nr:hypothetical protein CS546_08960 [Porphyromonas gingivalis]ATR96394.1 hypothetical protein CS548_04440 [Porphyromonas gingivalis]